MPLRDKRALTARAVLVGVELLSQALTALSAQPRRSWPSLSTRLPVRVVHGRGHHAAVHTVAPADRSSALAPLLNGAVPLKLSGRGDGVARADLYKPDRARIPGQNDRGRRPLVPCLDSLHDDRPAGLQQIQEFARPDNAPLGGVIVVNPSDAVAAVTVVVFTFAIQHRQVDTVDPDAVGSGAAIITHPRHADPDSTSPVPPVAP
jgi:hypothetical protein